MNNIIFRNHFVPVSAFTCICMHRKSCSPLCRYVHYDSTTVQPDYTFLYIIIFYSNAELSIPSAIIATAFWTQRYMVGTRYPHLWKADSSSSHEWSLLTESIVVLFCMSAQKIDDHVRVVCDLWKMMQFMACKSVMHTSLHWVGRNNVKYPHPSVLVSTLLYYIFLHCVYILHNNTQCYHTALRAIMYRISLQTTRKRSHTHTHTNTHTHILYTHAHTHTLTHTCTPIHPFTTYIPPWQYRSASNNTQPWQTPVLLWWIPSLLALGMQQPLDWPPGQ